MGVLLVVTAPSPRRFLFLQGMATSFFARLGEALVAAGHEVRRINFNGGDRVFWSLPGAIDYRGGLKDWARFLDKQLATWGTTDIILFGDCRPLHREAMALAVGKGIAIHVIEEGYLRPNWVTLESGGVNGHSSLPRDIEWYLAAAQTTPAWTGGRSVTSSFLRRAVQDVLYNLSSVALSPLYRGYRTHRPWNPLVEYVGWVPRLLAQRLRGRQIASDTQRIAELAGRYFLFPLQLDCDFQIRRHSPFLGMRPAIEQVLSSFAAFAPADSFLVVKEHPLDNGLINWRKAVRDVARANGLADRVIYLENGPIEPVLNGALGLVTVNSTSGFLGLAFDCPVIALGNAIYDLPQLTFQGGLDRFWAEGQRPDQAVFDAFRRVVADRTQINGGFFSRASVAMAVQAAVQRLARNGRGHEVECSESPKAAEPELARTATDEAA